MYSKVSVVVPCACLSLCPSFSLSVCLSITILVLHATAQLMSDIKSVSSASARKNDHFPETAAFELEKLAETWPDPSISVAHAYLYAYSATFGEKRHRRIYSSLSVQRIREASSSRSSLHQTKNTDFA